MKPNQIINLKEGKKMYTIEWKKSGANSLNSLFIDGQEYHSDCQKFAERCNDLEEKIKNVVNVTDCLYPDIFEKWINEEIVVELLGQIHFDYFIANSELGYSMHGNERLYDRWDVMRLKNQIKVK